MVGHAPTESTIPLRMLALADKTRRDRDDAWRPEPFSTMLLYPIDDGRRPGSQSRTRLRCGQIRPLRFHGSPFRIRRVAWARPDWS